MTPENFVYWLKGYSEMVKKIPDETQWKIIEDHLNLTLTKVTPHRPYALEIFDKELRDRGKIPIITC